MRHSTAGRRPEPLRRVGAYAPGGRAAYPSSVLMCVVPAKLAGVEEGLAREAMRRAAMKLPVKCKFVSREEL